MRSSINLSKQFLFLLFLGLSITSGLQAQEIAVLKYKGGGDWYANPTALPNLISYSNLNINTKIDPKPQTVEPDSPDIFQYPYIYMTGHGNVFFSDTDIENLRNYLFSGGFLHIDDNYGMEPYLVKALEKLVPDKNMIELPKTHPIFRSAFKFPEGLPKIQEHGGLRPQAFGIFDNDRLMLLFTYESDLGNGWEDQEVHNDPIEVREQALKMGANIIKYVFEN